MKKINKNIFVFIICFLIIGFGYFNLDFIGSIKNSIVHFFDNAKSNGVINSMNQFTDEVDDASTRYLSYHDQCINLNSLYMRATNTRVVEKDDETIVKMDNGMLAEEVEAISDESIDQYTNNIQKLQAETGIPVIYVMAPQKGYSGGLPSNANNYIGQNCDNFIDSLKAKNINYLDIRESMNQDKISEEDGFFATDHHWKPSTGLWATNEITQKLKNDYDFDYDGSMLDINNFKIDKYSNVFLGSEGRKSGIYFTQYGLEDFDVIYPSYTTNLTVTNPIKGTTRSGEFIDSVLNPQHLEFVTPYESWMYSTYSDGDNAVQIIENKLMPEGKTVLVIRDSFAGVVTPFLSLTCKSVHALDLRESVIGTERVKSVSDYAKNRRVL